MRRQVLRLFIVVLALAGTAAAQSSADPTPADTQPSPDGFFRDWFRMVAKSQAEQPHWITPLATTTPRLEQEFRYDILWQRKANGTTTGNYDGSKGLELIPLPRVEIIASLPPFLVHNDPNVRDGWGDFSWLVKFRMFAANEKHGDYILTAFLGMTVPTGSYKNGAKHPVITPTIAYGKGFGNFDVQGTFGVAMPTADTNTLGRQYLWNNAFQYRVLRKLWPEVEVNSTFFQEGPNAGKKQVFLTPGLILGKIPLWKRLGMTVGGGVQIAATRFHTSNHVSIFSFRLPF